MEGMTIRFTKSLKIRKSMVVTTILRFIFALENLKSKTINRFYMKHFENISNEELQILENAISQITLLIAVSDGDVNKEEIDWASKLVHIRTYSGDNSLLAFYEEVEANFNIKLNDLIKNSPKESEACKAYLSEKLADVNPVLAKLDPETAYHLYKSYLTLAKSIAKASGGILGFGAISHNEAHLITLSMITPIAQPTVDEEDESK